MSKAEFAFGSISRYREHGWAGTWIERVGRLSMVFCGGLPTEEIIGVKTTNNRHRAVVLRSHRDYKSFYSPGSCASAEFCVFSVYVM
jgi:hypothetical protein